MSIPLPAFAVNSVHAWQCLTAHCLLSHAKDGMMPKGSSKMCWVALASVDGVGPKTFRALLGHFGSPEAVLNASVEELVSAKVRPELAQRIKEAAARLDHIEAMVGAALLCGVHTITLQDELYPTLLRDLDDAPPVLYVRGDLLPADSLAVAIVGTRRPSEAGRALAKQLAFELSKRGFTIVSGLAVGVDTAAHEGAMGAEGRTLAVLGSGIFNIFPPENRDLAQRILASGALLSELHDPDALASTGTLMARNRIITGLSLGVIVIEASGMGTGSAAEKAKQQGRLLFAVDWQDEDPKHEGNRLLLAGGAEPISAKETDFGALAQRLQVASDAADKKTKPDPSTQPTDSNTTAAPPDTPA